MPPSGFNQEAVKGSEIFRWNNFAELQREVNSGKHVSMEAGAEFEITQISKALMTPSIDKVRKGVLLSTMADYEIFLERRRTHSHETIEDSIKFTVERVSRILTKLYINPEGNLVERN